MNQRYPGSFLGVLLIPEIALSLAMIGKHPSTSPGQLYTMLLKAGQHTEIALIKGCAAVSLDTAGASALLLFGSTVLRYGRTGKEK